VCDPQFGQVKAASMGADAVAGGSGFGGFTLGLLGLFFPSFPVRLESDWESFPVATSAFRTFATV